MKSKALRFLPLAFIAGTHGFALFAPYVAVVLAALHLRTRHRQRSIEKDRRRTAGAEQGNTIAPAASDPDLEPVPA